MISRLRSVYRRFFRKKVCADCRVKLDRHFGLKSKIKHRLTRHRRHRVSYSNRGRTIRFKSHTRTTSVKHKLRAGIHKVKIRGKLRKVKVLSSGQWRFMKSK